ncbi:MAG: hypothetical protein C5B48_00750 [Candidatus Rokuibacteriota bacterium]|nr:MAG: hypothetical protein C5B48_00750 [Candidatus Rokubacteria bacterium]
MPEEESFKITDRRGHGRDAEPESAPTEEPGPSPTGSSPIEPPASGTRRGPGPAPPDLQGLFVMFASSALVSLGQTADPATGEAKIDLAHAREAIDLLLLLRDKTAGNRTEQESRLLEEILYDLQMRFVSVSERKPR